MKSASSGAPVSLVIILTLLSGLPVAAHELTFSLDYLLP